MDTKKLRQKILDLAIHGKLVPQDPNDEPASELLKRINPSYKACNDEVDTDQLPDGWEDAMFQAVCNTISTKPYQILQSEIKDVGKTPVISQSANYIEGYSDREDCILKVENPVLVFGDHTRVLKYVDFDFIVGADGVKIIQTPITPQYVYYVLLHTIYNMQGKGYARHYSILSKTRIPVPPLEEQKRIVKAIEQLFSLIDVIEANKQDIQDNIDHTKSKILDLAIHGKLVPQDPNDEPAIELLKRINPKFEACENEYGDDRIPEKWCFCHIGDMANIIGGVSYKKDDIQTNGIRVLRGGNIQDGVIVYAEDDVFIVDTYYNEDNVVKKGDIVVVASTGSSVLIGKTGFATNDIPNTQIGAFLRIVRPNKQVLPHYINAIFLSDYYKTYIRNIAKGSNINNIKNSYLTDFVIALPPYQEQIRIVSKIEELFAILDDIKESLE